MAAYGAAVSLKNTITLILRSPRVVPTNPIIDHLAGLYYAVFDDSHFKAITAAYAASAVSAFHKSFIKWVMVAAYVAMICLNYKTWPTLLRAFFVKFLVLVKAYNAMSSLQKALLKLDDISCSKVRTKVNDLDERIKEAVWEFEDLLESHYANQILPQLESETSHLPFSVDMWILKQSVDCFVERVAVMEAEYEFELLNMPEEEGEPISSRIDFRGINSDMVGSSDLFEQVRDCLIEHEAIRLLVTGMAGVGKTATAMKIFEDPLIKRHFELRVWVKVGRVCQSTELLQCILAQVDPNTYNQMLTQGDVDDEKLVGLLKERLMYKKCLIVLDDVWEWDTHLMDKLEEVTVRILVTSRLAIKECVYQAKVCLLSEDESSTLLGYKVFGEEGFPPHLQKLGEKIAKKCEGLPLMLVTVVELL